MTRQHRASSRRSRLADRLRASGTKLEQALELRYIHLPGAEIARLEAAVVSNLAEAWREADSGLAICGGLAVVKVRGGWRVWQLTYAERRALHVVPELRLCPADEFFEQLMAAVAFLESLEDPPEVWP